jgi:ankyrin repeat protein
MSRASSIDTGGKPLLLRLPIELLFCIADFCTPVSLLDLVCCNKYLHGQLYSVFRRLGVTAYGGRAILWAASSGHLEFLQFLHRYGAPIFRKWNSDCFENDAASKYLQEPEFNYEILLSPLHLACSWGKDHVVSWLIDNGADVNEPCLWEMDDGFRPDPEDPLSVALYFRHDSTAKLLIEKGAATVTTVTVTDRVRDGWFSSTTLQRAVQCSLFETTKLLLTREPRTVDEVDAQGITPLGQLLLHGTSRGADERVDVDLAFLRLLLTRGASLATPTCLLWQRDGILPLHCAMLEGSYGAALLMLDAGADPNSTSAGYQPLHCAFNPSAYSPESRDSEQRWRSAQTSRDKLVKVLLAGGADPDGRAYFPPHDLASDGRSLPVDMRPTHGVTPLMYAAANGTCLDSIVTLIGFGANINAVDDWGQNALHWAIDPRYKPVDERIRQEATTRPIWWDKVKGEAAKVCRLLLEKGCDPGSKTKLGECAIRLLSSSRRDQREKKEILRVLLDHLSDEWITEGCLGSLVLAFLRLGDFDGIRLVEDAGWPEGHGLSVSAAEVMSICRDFPVAERLADEVVDYFTRMARFAERHGLVHLSEVEEGDGPRKELRDYLLVQEAKAIGFVKDYPFMFPRLFPTVEQPSEPELGALKGSIPVL